MLLIKNGKVLTMGPQGVLEQLRVRLVSQQRHRQAVPLPQRRLQDVLLHPIEVGEPVNIHVLAHQIVRLRQGVAQLLHAGAGVEPLPPQISAADRSLSPAAPSMSATCASSISGVT